MKKITADKFLILYNEHVRQKAKDYEEDTLKVSWHSPLSESQFARMSNLDIQGRRFNERITTALTRLKTLEDRKDDTVNRNSFLTLDM